MESDAHKTGKGKGGETAPHRAGKSYAVRDARTGRFISEREAALERILRRRSEAPPIVGSVGDLVRRSRQETEQ